MQNFKSFTLTQSKMRDKRILVEYLINFELYNTIWITSNMLEAI